MDLDIDNLNCFVSILKPYYLFMIRDKMYDWVAGCLIAFGCRFSVEKGKGNYQGFLTFESKTELIPVYARKYGAKRTKGLKMFIHEEQGEKLIEKYLGNE